ncbi:MAG: hypothetical protein ACHP79_09055, partial [Terriglobales bacterium]
MTTLTLSAGEITEFWRISRRLHAIYAELDQMFELGQPSCPELDSRVDSSDPETMERVQQWFETMDAHVQVWQLRQLLQSTSLQNEENLRYLIKRHLDRKEKTESDKEKIDFLLVQYFAHCAPHGINEQLLSLDEVAEVLEPALGATPEAYPDWAPGLDDKLQKLNECNCLEDLQNSGGLLEVRELKLAVGDKYFDPGHLVAFTRFNFRARRAFFKAMHLDLHAIRGAVNELERMGYTTLDCREAGLTESESLDQVRHVVHQWKTPFRAPYSGGSSFLQLILLRHALRLKLQEAHARHSGQGGEMLEGSEAPAPLMPLLAVPVESAHAVAGTTANIETPVSPAIAEMAVSPAGHGSFESADVREIDLDQTPIEPVHVPAEVISAAPAEVGPEAVSLEAAPPEPLVTEIKVAKTVAHEAALPAASVALESPAPPPPPPP